MRHTIVKPEGLVGLVPGDEVIEASLLGRFAVEAQFMHELPLRISRPLHGDDLDECVVP